MKRELWGDAVIRQIAAHPDPVVRRQFLEVAGNICARPFDRKLGVLPSKEDGPLAWSVPFDNALLFYEVLADHPWVHLLHVHWHDDE